ncbi:MAG: DUF5681 domain-containing protein [Hyphomonadaceae bacterium]|nr:DUF5681 domain-containing protein [Hyphomonadaceae bacterium]
MDTPGYTKTGKPLGDHKIGYARPPQDSKWKKGQTGNPSGKKKARKDFGAALNDLLDKKVPVRIDGKIVQMTGREAMMHNLFLKAMTGNLRDMVAFTKFIEATTPAALDPEPPPRTRVVFHFQDVRDGQPTMTRSEWMEDMARQQQAREERGLPPVRNVADLAQYYCSLASPEEIDAELEEKDRAEDAATGSESDS